MKLLREMLNEQSTDEEDKDECYEDGSENEDSEEAEKDEDEEEEFDKRDSGEEEDQGQDNCNTLYDEEVKDNGGDHCQVKLCRNVCKLTLLIHIHDCCSCLTYLMFL